MRFARLPAATAVAEGLAEAELGAGATVAAEVGAAAAVVGGTGTSGRSVKAGEAAPGVGTGDTVSGPAHAVIIMPPATTITATAATKRARRRETRTPGRGS